MKLSEKEERMIRRNRAKSLLDELVPLFRSLRGGGSDEIDAEMISVIARHMNVNEN